MLVAVHAIALAFEHRTNLVAVLGLPYLAEDERPAAPYQLHASFQHLGFKFLDIDLDRMHIRACLEVRNVVEWLYLDLEADAVLVFGVPVIDLA